MSNEKDILAAVLMDGNSTELINNLYLRFKNLYSIVNADEDELLSIKGMGMRKIKKLKSIPELLEYYALEVLEDTKLAFSMKDFINYLFVKLKKLKFEVFIIASIDIKKNFLGVEQIFRGSINTATIYPRDLVEHALSVGASYVVLAHNHPSGIASPSKEDIEITKIMFNAFYIMNIRVLDHIIIAGSNKFSFREDGILDSFKEDFHTKKGGNLC